MYPNVFYAKTAMVEEQVASKDAIGHDGLEYQLLLSDFSSDRRSLIDRNGKAAFVESHPASAVHPPLPFCNAEDILVPSENCVLEESMRLAQMSADVTGSRCLTVVHVAHPPCELSRDVLDGMERELERLLSLFPNVDIVLENITPLRDFGLGLPEFCNGYYDANVQLAARWASFGGNDEGGKRVMTCLDICHARLTAFYMDALKGVYMRDPEVEVFPIDYSMRAYFKMNAPHLGLIHLASASGNGYGRGHGIPFDKDTGAEMDVLEEVFDMYDELGLSCPVTLEVREDDFTVSDCYWKSLAAAKWLATEKTNTQHP